MMCIFTLCILLSKQHFRLPLFFFSSEVTGCNTVPNSVPQVFSLHVSEAVIQPQEMPIAVSARPINSNQYGEAEEAQTEQKAFFTRICCLPCITFISPNFLSACQ